MRISGFFFSFILFLLFWIFLISITWWSWPLQGEAAEQCLAGDKPGTSLGTSDPVPLILPSALTDAEGPRSQNAEQPKGSIQQPEGTSPSAIPIDTSSGKTWPENEERHDDPEKDAPAVSQTEKIDRPDYDKANKRTPMGPTEYELIMDSGEVYLQSLIEIPLDSKIYFNFQDTKGNSRLKTSQEVGDQDIVLGNGTIAEYKSITPVVWYQVPAVI
jgi:hypothetical protein